MLLGSSMSLALTGRCQQRSNLFQTDLSPTQVTYLCKLPGMCAFAALL